MKALDWVWDESRNALVATSRNALVATSHAYSLEDGFEHRIEFVGDGKYLYKPSPELASQETFFGLGIAVLHAENVEKCCKIDALEDALNDIAAGEGKADDE